MSQKMVNNGLPAGYFKKKKAKLNMQRVTDSSVKNIEEK